MLPAGAAAGRHTQVSGAAAERGPTASARVLTPNCRWGGDGSAALCDLGSPGELQRTALCLHRRRAPLHGATGVHRMHALSAAPRSLPDSGLQFPLFRRLMWYAAEHALHRWRPCCSHLLCLFAVALLRCGGCGGKPALIMPPCLMCHERAYWLPQRAALSPCTLRPESCWPGLQRPGPSLACSPVLAHSTSAPLPPCLAWQAAPVRAAGAASRGGGHDPLGAGRPAGAGRPSGRVVAPAGAGRQPQGRRQAAPARLPGSVPRAAAGPACASRGSAWQPAVHLTPERTPVTGCRGPRPATHQKSSSTNKSKKVPDPGV